MSSNENSDWREGRQPVSATMRWAAAEGSLVFSDGLIRFKGAPVTFKNLEGQDEVGVAVGLALNNRRFSGGEIAAQVEFSKIGDRNACGLVFYYDPRRRAILSAGLGGPGMYFIRLWDGSKWIVHAAGGTRSSLEAARSYDLRAVVRGSRVTLSVDGVDVLESVVPYAVPPSQTGIHFLDDADVFVRNFHVSGRRGSVFVVMQFSSPFMELHDEVIKAVCNEAGLDAHRADETYGPGLIIADVERDIIDSEFIIAEITPANPNVYYEIGYAQALNKPVILLANKEGDKLPFDIAGNRVLFYENSIAGKRRFEEGLRKHIRSVLERDSVVSAAQS
jgi:hypothetical protein